MLKQYPEGEIARRNGCKVGWLTYKTQELAKECRESAIYNAEILRTKGYEFGYVVPGSITETEQGWEVTIP
jgi:hypothetical protein